MKDFDCIVHDSFPVVLDHGGEAFTKKGRLLVDCGAGLQHEGWVYDGAKTDLHVSLADSDHTPVGVGDPVVAARDVGLVIEGNVTELHDNGEVTVKDHEDGTLTRLPAKLVTVIPTYKPQTETFGRCDSDREPM